MSIAYLKNLIFPTRPLPRNPTVIPISEDEKNAVPDRKLQFADLDQHLDGNLETGPAAHKSNPIPITRFNSDSTLDVEAQRHEDFHPQDEGPARKRRRFELSPRMISDAIIGLSDGMTVPFALTAGLSSLGNTRLVVLGGLAELIAGAISMGLGGFIGAKSEADSYKATVTSTQKLIHASPSETSSLVEAVFRPYGLSTLSMSTISKSLHDSPADLLDFLMRFHHQMPEPETSRPFISAATIALGYFIGGFIPLIPYFCVNGDEVLLALWWSIGIMAIALFAFGWVKTGVVSGWRGRRNVFRCVKGGIQMVVVGGVAAGAAVGLVRAINR